MSLRPIDMSITVQRTPEMTRANENARPEVTQQQFADRLNKESLLQEQRVVNTHKSEQNNVDPDGKGHGGFQKRKKKKDEKGKKNTGSMLDISV